LVSNGLETFGLSPTLHDASKIDWLKKLDYQMVEIWRECWFFASWVPGETKYPNFIYYMEDKLQNFDSD
jgi:hypothetical protein